MDNFQGDKAVLEAPPSAAQPPSAPALCNMMAKLPEALITVLLEHMFRSDLTHSDRAALQSTNRCLRRLCRALGSFHLLRTSSKALFVSQQQLTSATLVDGVKIVGNAVDFRCVCPIDLVGGQPLLCIALGGIVTAPTASSIRALHIDTSNELLPGLALGSLCGLRSLQALKIHSVHPSDVSAGLDTALGQLKGLTSLDVKVKMAVVPDWCAWTAEWYQMHDVLYPGCSFSTSLAKCSCLRRLSLYCGRVDFVSMDELPADFGNLTALETLSLVGCEVISLPPTFAQLTRLTSLTIANADGGFESEMQLMKVFCSGMQNLQRVNITRGQRRLAAGA